MPDAVEIARLKAKPLTPEQERRRAEVQARTAAIASGVKRGPSAPSDGTFGGKPKAPKS